MEGHHTSTALFTAISVGAKRLKKGNCSWGWGSAPGTLWIPKQVCSSRCACAIPVYTNYPCKWAGMISMHNYLHLQAQHLHPGAELVCGCCLFGFSHIVSVSIASAAPHLHCCQHRASVTSSGAFRGKDRWDKEWEQPLPTPAGAQAISDRGEMGMGAPGTHQMSLMVPAGLGLWPQAHPTHPPSPALLLTAPPLPSGSLIQLSFKNTIIVQKLFISALLSVTTVRYAILEHGFTLIICQLILTAYV